MEKSQKILWLIINHFFPLAPESRTTLRLLSEGKFRKTVISLIYLCQEAGLGLSYTFKLNEHNLPVSEELNADYANMLGELLHGPQIPWPKDYNLKDDFVAQLDKITPLITEPITSDLALIDSLTILRVTHFYKAHSRLGTAEIKKICQDNKSQHIRQLHEHVPSALLKLEEYNLLKFEPVTA